MDTDRDLITMQDFIVGRLADDERRVFEDRLVHEPRLARELEQSLRMREGFRQLRAQGYFTKAAARSRSFPNWFPLLAAAAAAGLALFLWLSPVVGPAPILMRPPGAGAAPEVAAISAHFTFVSFRGSSVPDLELPSAGLIEFRIAPTTPASDRNYRVTLLRRAGEGSHPVGSVSGLSLSEDGYVHCLATAARLTPGDYLLRIQPDGDHSGVAEAFPFNLRIQTRTAPSR
ncbi:MAG TPA: hypothetical protein VET46_01645 [Steroidobacteraceae bacterium]|nr:hypothetical protein [Steroidobacteraceae bacterium]